MRTWDLGSPFDVRREVGGRGIGRKLMAAIEAAAQRLGLAQLYAGSGRAASSFGPAGWQVLERISSHGEEIAISAGICGN